VNRFTFFLGEGFRALRRSTAPSIAAIVTVAVTILLLGVLIPILQTTGGKTEEVRDQVTLRVFIYDDATTGEVAALGDLIRNTQHVESATFVSKDQALTKLRGFLENDDPVNVLPQGRNPLPRSFEIKPDDLDNMEAIAAALAPEDASGTPQPVSAAIEDVKDSRADAAPIRSVTGFVKIFLIVIAIVLVIASLLLVGNTIRLSIYSRRREVEVMRLVGGTNWFIRWPFMIEGLFCGAIGGLLAVSVLILGKVAIVDPLANSIDLISADGTMPFIGLVFLLLFLAMAVSALGSGLTLRRFLKV
jgi:cell division transport system permease protein